MREKITLFLGNILFTLAIWLPNLGNLRNFWQFPCLRIVLTKVKEIHSYNSSPHALPFVSACIELCAWKYVCMCVCVCVRVREHACVHSCMLHASAMCVYMRTCILVCVPMCTYMHMWLVTISVPTTPATLDFLFSIDKKLWERKPLYMDTSFL